MGDPVTNPANPETTRPDGDIVYSLPANTEAPALARRYLRQHGTGLPQDLLDDAAVVTSEIVTNAVLHGQPEVTLRLRLDPPSVGVAVHDCGDPSLPGDPHAPKQTDPHGRGLLIAATLATAWGVDTSDGPGKTVWFELRHGAAG